MTGVHVQHACHNLATCWGLHEGRQGTAPCHTAPGRTRARAAPQAILPTAKEAPKLLSMALPVLSVLLSITVGACGGLILSIVMRPQSILVPTWTGLPQPILHR